MQPSSPDIQRKADAAASATPLRTAVAAAQRVVVKLGTRVLREDRGTPASERVASLVAALAARVADGHEVLLVSSGAVGLGAQALGFAEVPAELQERQACAAVGQSRLMSLYADAFGAHGLTVGQVLLTQGDFDHRVRYLNLRSTLTTLLRHGVVPVINENDAVSTEELAYAENEPRQVFGDNDRLSALVASKLEAQLLLLLTDVEGVYERDPRADPAAQLIAEVSDPDCIEVGAHRDHLSRGGMASKIAAAGIAARAGCHVVIASGLAPDAAARVLAGEPVGTWFRARARPGARRRWIAFAAAPRGALTLDRGAVAAVRGRGASVLAAGVSCCEGDFRQGDVVELKTEDGDIFGRGIVFCDAATTRAWCAGRRPEGVRNHHALVHRDHLIMDE